MKRKITIKEIAMHDMVKEGLHPSILQYEKIILAIANYGDHIKTDFRTFNGTLNKRHLGSL